MKKAELEQHYAEYQARMTRARAHEVAGLYARALDEAMSAWPYIDGMMQYGRKYKDAEFDSVAAIELVLKYAPLLLKGEALDRLDDLLKVTKRIDKLADADLAQRAADARQRMWRNRRLFHYLESYPDSRQDELRVRLGGDQNYWRSASETWERMGLLERVPERPSYRLAFVTRLGQLVRGKCPSCGDVAHAPKAMFFEEMMCGKCGRSVVFVLLGADARQAQEV